MLDHFVHQYSLQKTLRFELKPINETADYLENFKSEHLKSIVASDQQRSDNYQRIKPLIDNLHRHYIETSLTTLADPTTGEWLITPEQMENAYSYYQHYKRSPRDLIIKTQQQWHNTQQQLRKQLVKAFHNNKHLFDKPLIEQGLPDYLKAQGLWEEHQQLIESFKGFTSYFSGLSQNRKNMYVADDHSTAISYRLINENLPRFFQNCEQFARLGKTHSQLTFTDLDTLLQPLGTDCLENVFQPRFFLNLLTQSRIDAFNQLLGSHTHEDRSMQHGLNPQINLYRQKNQLKPKQLPGFTPLYKQILSDREQFSFVPKAFNDDKALLTALAELIETIQPQLEQLQQQSQRLQEAELTQTYIKREGLRSLSQTCFSTWQVMDNALTHHATQLYPANSKGIITKTIEKQREDYATKQAIYRISDLNAALQNYIQTLETDDPLHEQLTGLALPDNPVGSYFLTALEQANQTLQEHQQSFDNSGILQLSELSKERRLPKDETDTGGKGFQQIQHIKTLLDAYLAMIQVFRPLHLVKNRKSIDVPDIDSGFYSEFEACYSQTETMLVSFYNQTRNHLSKKPFSTNKIKLNFNAPTLLNGWDINKEKDNKSIILRKNGLYYLAIIHPKHSKLFVDAPSTDDDTNHYEKMNYKLLSGANKMLPKVFFSKKGLATFNPPQDILALYKNNEHKKGKTFNLKSCHRLIDFFKQNIPHYKTQPTDSFGWDIFGFNFSPTSDYQDISDFYREVEAQGYKTWFSRVDVDYIDQCVADGKLFLFQIYNKDFSPHSKGKPNLHTLYWKTIFSAENLKNTVVKLNGEAEIFYRRHTIKKADRTIHRAGEVIANKNALNPKDSSTFAYDLIKDRRYTVDKFQFHVPITLNMKAQGAPRFNDRINALLAQHPNTSVIGIDRGERHLLYYTVVNSQGDIIEQGSLNRIATDQGYAVDYQAKLHQKEKERDQARKSWSSIENIKELKQGYLSHIVHKLAQLIIKHNAIVCLEDLNSGFKRGRFKVEKQVYQKFEKALIDKLNYLVFKDAAPETAGSVSQAYQLTAPFESFEKLRKQTGILYYVRADYTSKIDPATGFVDFVRPKYESRAKAHTLLSQCAGIRYNPNADYFEFEFDYKKLNPHRKWGSYQTRWTVCTHGDTRYQNKPDPKTGQWHTETINVTQNLKKLLIEAGISYEQGQDLRNALCDVQLPATFYKTLFWLLRLTLSLRHSKTGTDDDFILSPVANEQGEFFDSRHTADDMPHDADANGAYHIALKGLWNLQQIRQHDWDCDKPKPLNLNLSNEDWLGFAQNKQYREA